MNSLQAFTAPPEEPRGLPSIVNGTDLMRDHTLVLPDALIDGLLHQGSKMILGGSSKSYKTWVILHLGVCVSEGREWWGFQTTKKRVLFINFEIGDAFFKDRLSHIADAEIGEGATTDNFDVWNLRGYSCDLRDLCRSLLEGIEKHDVEPYGLIIIDPIYKGLGDADENSAGDIGGLMNAVEQLVVNTGAAVVFAAHFSKGNQAGKTPMDRISGSGVFARDPDTIVVLTEHDEEWCYTADFVTRNSLSPPSRVVKMDWPLMKHEEDLNPEALKGRSGGRKPKLSPVEIAELLPDRGLTSKEWEIEAAVKFEIGESCFKALRKKCHEDGLVVKSNGEPMAHGARYHGKHYPTVRGPLGPEPPMALREGAQTKGGTP